MRSAKEVQRFIASVLENFARAHREFDYSQVEFTQHNKPRHFSETTMTHLMTELIDTDKESIRLYWAQDGYRTYELIFVVERDRPLSDGEFHILAYTDERRSRLLESYQLHQYHDAYVKYCELIDPIFKHLK